MYDRFPRCEITDDVVKGWTKKLKLIAANMVHRQDWFVNQVHISEMILGFVFHEVRKDCHAILNRRDPENDVSIGKIAGIVTFQLSRFAPFQISEDLLNNEKAMFLNTYIAIAFSIHVLLVRDVSNVREELIKELIYTLSRRHTNQETLGMVFEAIDLS